MELSNRTKLSNQILDDSKLRYCEIYKITNLTTSKVYIGQAVSHILNHNRYRPHGREARFRCHVSEAFSSKKNQSRYLNNAIKKYGIDDFDVELLEYCELEQADIRETYYITLCNGLFPHGYNLKLGGKQFEHTDESKKRVSFGVQKYYSQQKLDRFKDIKHISTDIEQYIRPLLRKNNQYGWYVYIEKKKADFGGVHISLEDSKNMAVDFINKLIQEQMATHLDAGNPLEPLTTTP
jgi:group I intron endonuclease